MLYSAKEKIQLQKEMFNFFKKAAVKSIYESSEYRKRIGEEFESAVKLY